MALADEIRRFVYDNYIRPARERRETQIVIVAGEVHSRMGLKSRMPAVCSALRSVELQRMCNVRLVKEIRQTGVKRDSSTNVFVFELKSAMESPESLNAQTRKGGEMTSEQFEELCRVELSKYFGVPLSKGKVSGIPKEFDMVSSDGDIVGDAKYLTMVRGEKIPPAKFSVIAEHVWLLEKTSSRHKFLVFGNDRRVPIEWLKRYGHLVENVRFFFLNTKNRKLEQLH